MRLILRISIRDATDANVVGDEYGIKNTLGYYAVQVYDEKHVCIYMSYNFHNIIMK